MEQDDRNLHIKDRVTWYEQPKNGGKREALAAGLKLAKMSSSYSWTPTVFSPPCHKERGAALQG